MKFAAITKHHISLEMTFLRFYTSLLFLQELNNQQEIPFSFENLQVLLGFHLVARKFLNMSSYLSCISVSFD